ncbi:MAG: phosphotransferase [Betaproteobacteria bacterium AqS2]|uniref:Phosphotransferase n=1 Tax=Candidatus Amphirhobacter heronislandensis TaxID=1732024 RepID=A0A930XW76_9GAMM|nr:phosphotransferase [Betaproteobacteria bacterium AqS2]
MTAAAAPPDPEDELLAWLEAALGRAPACEPVAADASPTRYYRLDGGAEKKLAMAADGPAALEMFIGRGKILADAGVRVPAVHAAEPARGYAVIEDFGDRLYSAALREDGVDRRRLYEDAWEAGARINAVTAEGLPRFDATLLAKEASYLPKWYADAYRGQPLDEDEANAYAAVAAALQQRFCAQPFVPCHRDWHSRNIFALAEGPGVIDYAAMLAGPLCYDAASLLHDLYAGFEEEEKLDLLARHWELLRARGLPAPADFGAYFEDYEWTALQRLVKILGQFVFLERDRGRPGFEAHVPKCETMVHAIALRYRELRPLALLIERRVHG